MKVNQLLTVLAIVAATPATAQQLRIASNFPTQHTSSVAMEQFKAEVEAATKKQVTVDLFPAMQLGGAQENVDQTRSGAIFGTVIGAAFLSRTVPEISALSVPFLFTGREQAFRVVDGRVGKLIAERLEAKGFHLHGFMELGSRNVTNNRQQIRSLADFKGLKIRLQPDDIHLATFRALGANPVAMDIKEVYSALQQAALDAAMAKAIARQRADAATADLEALDELKKRGMQFEQPSPQLLAEMRKATAGVLDLLKKKVDARLVDEVIASSK